MKENNGRGARKKLSRQVLAICGSFGLLIATLALMGVGRSGNVQLRNTYGSNNNSNSNSKNKNKMDQRQLYRQDPAAEAGDASAAQEQAAQFRQDLRLQFQEKDEGKLLDLALKAEIHLVDLHVVEEELLASPPNSYAGVYGSFCKIDWHLHKEDPSGVPMFRDLVGKSKACQEGQWKLDIRKLATLAKHQDRTDGSTPKRLNLTAVVFHESRCGSTLVANTLAAMDPVKHRAYSEAQPSAMAIKSVCGEHFSRCTIDQAAQVLGDVMYLMSRTNDPQEERVFFKFQSITTKYLSVFQKAFPDVPWMFIYRDPVQVMMSHVKDDPTLTRAGCVRSKRSPPQDIQAIAKRHGIRKMSDMTSEAYCAAHLAAITEAAVDALDLNDNGIPVLYDQLPDVLYETILPNIMGRTLTEPEVSNIQQVSHQYSKGRGRRAGEFAGDSEQKEQAASEAVHEAATKYLQESFDELSEYQPKLLV